MGKSLLSKRNHGDKEVHKTFFQWLMNNDQKVILNSYRNWQIDQEKVQLATGQT